MPTHILVIDQSTTATRALVFDPAQDIVGEGSMEVTQHQFEPDRVEQVPEEIWATCLWACETAIRRAGITARDIAGIGIANQRSTVVVWDRATGRAIHNAIVWRDQRTASACGELFHAGHEPMVRKKTGLLIHPFFSALKIKWLLDNVEGARERAERGELAFGTIDSFLIWRLTGGKVHATDATNAAQTSLFDIGTNNWDSELLDLFAVPSQILPEVKDSADDYGASEADIFGAPVPILGVVGNQQAALIGQACFAPGMLKATYDEHCFAMLNTGDDIVNSDNRLLTTIAYRLDGKPTYAIEGAVVFVGGGLQWLHDDIALIDNWGQLDGLAASSDPALPIYMVPGFIGGGADWLEVEARGAIIGLSLGTRPADLVRAALEAAGYQSHDLFKTMREDWGSTSDVIIRADGDVTASDWNMQFLADITLMPVVRTNSSEIIAMGAAWLAAWRAGLWPDQADFASRRYKSREFHPRMAEDQRQAKLAGWRDATGRVAPLPR
ncbi:FGGY family carbohydrate kinase [Devosia sp. SL43]|uniref:FGGY family carbohydrate kinase n=1 Tax=Devosia sp. SL43 TaxID=2806348 RepID=UPI001F3BF4E9|nr:glycerol kinase GlpK [Devosia sp. SL43]UJW86974.1 glycerol kinase GlpK [Devosia sp. SL43]